MVSIASNRTLRFAKPTFLNPVFRGWRHAIVSPVARAIDCYCLTIWYNTDVVARISASRKSVTSVTFWTYDELFAARIAQRGYKTRIYARRENKPRRELKSPSPRIVSLALNFDQTVVCSATNQWHISKFGHCFSTNSWKARRWLREYVSNMYV